MTTYAAITNGELDAESPATDTLWQRFRDNPLAVFENDASAPVALLPIVLLGTLTTTSGASQTLSSLVLTPYKFLIFSWNAVSQSAFGGAIGIGPLTTAMASLTTVHTNTVSGIAFVDLANGVLTAMSVETGGTTKISAGASGYSTATTSVSVNTSGTFDAGSVRVYGAK